MADRYGANAASDPTPNPNTREFLTMEMDPDPMGDEQPQRSSPGGGHNSMFRINRYPETYAGLLGRDLTPGNTLEFGSDLTDFLLASFVFWSSLGRDRCSFQYT